MSLIDEIKSTNYVVLGNTIASEKTAYVIKNELLSRGYKVEAVHKELTSLNEVSFDEFILDVVINPSLGLKYIKEMTKRPSLVIFQPDTFSEDIAKILDERKIPYEEACLLFYLRRRK